MSLPIENLAAAAGGPDFSGELFVLGGVALTGVLGWIGSLIVKRTKARASEPEMWARLDRLSIEVYGGKDEGGHQQPGLRDRLETTERKAAAAGRVIRDIARQWKGAAPRLNPADLEELDEDTIPADHPWRLKP